MHRKELHTRADTLYDLRGTAQEMRRMGQHVFASEKHGTDMDKAELLKSLVEDHNDAGEEIDRLTQKIDELRDKRKELVKQKEALEPAIRHYSETLGIDVGASTDDHKNNIEDDERTPDLEGEVNYDVFGNRIAAGDDEKPEFTDLPDSEKDVVMLDYLNDVGRFRKIGEILDDLGEEWELSRHNVRTVLERLMHKDKVVLLQYGNSKRYVAYGLDDFITVDEEDAATVTSPAKWPEMHDSMRQVPAFYNESGRIGSKNANHEDKEVSRDGAEIF